MAKRKKLPDPITVPVSIRCICSSEAGGGTLHFNVTDSVAIVSDEETGERYGEVAACFGGGLELRDERRAPGETWYISPQNAWAAFQALLDAKGVSDAAIRERAT